jgi:non-ribosomal peptide synthase protein (TIGR01720 family)
MSEPAPLSPTQSWILSRPIQNPGKYNMIMGFEVGAGVSPQVLKDTFASIAARHEAMQMRFEHHGNTWRQLRGNFSNGLDVAQIDLSHLSSAQANSTFRAICRELRRKLSIAQCPLALSALVRVDDASQSRLVIVVSHLIFDGYSRPIFLKELIANLDPSVAFKRTVDSRFSSTFTSWTRSLHRYSNSPQGEREFSYWRALPWERVGRLPKEVPGTPQNNYGSSEDLRFLLAASESKSIIARGPLAFPVVLTAFARAYCQLFGVQSVLMDITGHGRSDVFPGICTRESIGCFTVNTPLVLTVSRDSAAVCLRETLTQLSQLPMSGIGYGALRYLSKDPVQRAFLAEKIHSEIKFNFRGRRPVATHPSINILPLDIPGAMEPTDLRDYVLNVEVNLQGHEIAILFKFSNHLNHRGTIQSLAKLFMSNLRDDGNTVE